MRNDGDTGEKGGDRQGRYLVLIGSDGYHPQIYAGIACHTTGASVSMPTNVPSLTSVSDLLSLQLIFNATSYTSESTSIRHADYARNRRKLVSALANGARRVGDHVYINIKGLLSTVPYLTTINHFL